MAPTTVPAPAGPAGFPDGTRSRGRPSGRTGTSSSDGRFRAPALAVASVTVIIFFLAVTSTARGGVAFLREAFDGDEASLRHL
ncbi:hypothetical protein GCM10010398_70670 [Streptomyces fimbriatus]